MRPVLIAVSLTIVLIIGGVLGYVMLQKDKAPQGPGDQTDVVKPVNDKPEQRPTENFIPPESLPDANIKVTIQVNVQDETKNPVENAVVRVIRKSITGSSSPNMKPIEVLRTNKKGMAATRQKVSTGKYTFHVTGRGYTVYMGDRTISEGDNRVFQVAITLYSESTISGRVFDQNNQPIENARVIVYREIGTKDGNEFDKLMGLLERTKLELPVSEARSNGNGQYAVGNLETGKEYAMKVLAKGFQPGKKNYVRAGSRNVDFTLNKGSILMGEVVSVAKGPLSGAVVSAYPQSKGKDLWGSIAAKMRGAVDTVTADANGQFQFLTLGEGAFTMRASAPGHQDGTADVTLMKNGNATVQITLSQGLVLEGIVEGPDGSPIPEAKVKARSQEREPGRMSPMGNENDKEVNSDAAGRFLFDTLTPGKYTLIVSHGGFATERVRDVPVPQENFRVTIGMGGAIGGLVTDQQGNPIEGAVITVPDLSGIQKEAVTDASGRYQLPGLALKPSSKKSVSVHAPGFSRPESQRITVYEDKIVEVNFQLKRSSIIRGVVMDSMKQPIENVKVLVELMPTETNPVHRYLGFDHSKVDGSFQIPDVGPAENVRLIAESGYYLSWKSDATDIGEGEDIEVEIVMEVGGAIYGRVIDESGRPLSGVKVYVVAPGESGVRDFLGGSSDSTEENGRFDNLKGLAPNNYEVVAELRGYLTARSEVIELSEGKDVSGIQIQMTKGRSVAGIVVDNQANPIPSARITVIDISSGTRKIPGLSESDGKWRVDELGQDPVEIQCEAKGFGKQVYKDVPPDTEDLRIVLPALGGIQGAVIDVDGNPVQAYSVKPEPIQVAEGYERPKTRFKTHSSPQGIFLCEDLPPGTYRVNIQAPGYRGIKVEEVEVVSESITDTGAHTMVAGGVLSGVVVDGDGRPVAAAAVSVVGGRSRFRDNRTSNDQASMFSDSAGRFRFEGLKSGTVTIRASKSGYLSVKSKPVNPDQMTEDLVLTLGVGGSVVGVLLDKDEQPIAGENIYLKGPTSKRLPTGNNGWFEFNDLPAGHYSVGTVSFNNPQANARLEFDLPAGERVEVTLRKKN